MKRLAFLIPLAIAVALGSFLYWGLDPERDPRSLPSVLIDRPVPDFDLPPIPETNVPGLSRDTIIAARQPMLVNVFASWCGPCRLEHPVLTRLVREEGVLLVGLNYKDAPEDARAWLEEVGNPYAQIGSDVDGRAGIEWGVFGVPETFVVDAEGTVLMRHVGPITTPEAEAALLSALRGGEVPG